MTLPDGYRLVPLSEPHLKDVLTLDIWAFPTSASLDDLLKAPVTFDWDRVWGVVRDEPDADAVPIDGAVPQSSPLAAMHASYAFSQFPVPGAQIPVSGLTWVGVHPQDRRRGILSAMIDQHFQDCLDRGESVSALTAAEAAIYGRFGYGEASQHLRVTVPRRAALVPVAGSADLTVRIEEMTQDRHGELIGELHAKAGQHPTPASGINRPGWATRETEGLRNGKLSDLPAFRNGRESLRIIVVERDGEPRGYVTFRRKIDWKDEGPRGTVSTGEVVALDPAGAHRLWSTLLDLDLTDQVEPFFLPVDDVVLELLRDPRAIKARISDNVWIRIVDLPTALSSRRYAADVDLVLHVRDDRLPANQGSWRLTAKAFDSSVQVSRTDDTPDLSLSVGQLGAVYLGAGSLTSAAMAGLVEEHTEGAIRQAAAAFGWPVAPVCSWIF